MAGIRDEQLVSNAQVEIWGMDLERKLRNIDRIAITRTPRFNNQRGSLHNAGQILLSIGSVMPCPSDSKTSFILRLARNRLRIRALSGRCGSARNRVSANSIRASMFGIGNKTLPETNISGQCKSARIKHSRAQSKSSDLQSRSALQA